MIKIFLEILKKPFAQKNLWTDIFLVRFTDRINELLTTLDWLKIKEGFS
jgi:hypothetical protein